MITWVKLIGHWWQKARTRKGRSRFIYLERGYQVRWVTQQGDDVWGTERKRVFDNEDDARRFVAHLQEHGGGEWAGGDR